MEELNTDFVNKLMLNPTNVKDGIKGGAFQGAGYLGRGPGIYLGDVFPYSITPNYSATDLLTATIPALSTVYLSLGTIPFDSFPNYVSLVDKVGVTGGKCVKFDYERGLDFYYDQDCEVIVSAIDRYDQKFVTKYTFEGDAVDPLDPCLYLNSIQVKNKSNTNLNVELNLNFEFGVPYNMLFNAFDYTKMLLFDGNPLYTSENIPSQITWLPIIQNGVAPETKPTITTGFTRPRIDFEPLFGGANPPFAARPMDGQRVLTMYTHHFGFGILPPYANDEQQRLYLNGNLRAILGAALYSENFVTWM